MSGTARYVAILRTPHVAPLLLASMLARLPFGLYALAVVLYLAEARDSYAVAGLVDGAFGLGAAIGVPVQSRLIDRFGQRGVLLPMAIVDATSTGLLIALTESDAPTLALVGCALVGGFAVPAIGSAMRALWPELLRKRDELLSTAFALDGVSIELLFTVGPLLSAAIIAFVSPIAALALSAACALTGTLLFVTRKPSREWRPHATAGSHGLLGALRAPGVVTVALSAAPVGFCFGTVEISMPAFAESFGAPEWAGLLLSVWAAASAVGGLAYGARHWTLPLPSLFLRISLLPPHDLERRTRPGRTLSGMPLSAFTPQVREWFERAFAEPTKAQAQAWPAIATGEHTLISAPTGSGKTLAAFLWGLDRFVAEPREADEKERR